MDLRQLKYFVAIVDYASLSKAANHLYVAQPALSQHVRHMEEELLVTLLLRTPRGVEPTDEGRRLYLHAKKVLTLAAETPDIVRDAALNPVGEVRVGMSGTVSELLSVPLIQACRERYPRVRIRPVEAMSGYVLEWLRRGDVDLAVAQVSTEPKGLVAHPVLTEELFLFGKAGTPVVGAPPESIVSLNRALQLELVLPGLCNGLRSLIEEAALLCGQQVHPLLEVDSYTQIKKLGLIGAGCGILPESAIADEVRDGRLHRWHLGPTPLRRRIHLLHSSERMLSAAVRAIARLAWDVARDMVRERQWLADLEAQPEKLDV